MFSKIVAIEPVSFIPSAEEALHTLLSYTSSIRREVMERCPNIKYIGMCCSLYSPESANVDIIYANEHGIKVTGIRDYGDEGVVEYVISELVRCFHGFGQPAWEGEVREITGLKAGIIGPTKVSRVALENAASIASMFLTTECVLAEKKSDAPAMPAMPAGGMGGMM